MPPVMVVFLIITSGLQIHQKKRIIILVMHCILYTDIFLYSKRIKYMRLL